MSSLTLRSILLAGVFAIGLSPLVGQDPGAASVPAPAGALVPGAAAAPPQTLTSPAQTPTSPAQAPPPQQTKPTPPPTTKPSGTVPTSPAMMPPGMRDPRDVRTMANVRMEVTITDQHGSAGPIKKTLTMMIADGQSGAIRSWITAPQTKDTPPRRYSLNLDVRRVMVEGNNVQVNLSLEYNPPETATGETAPPEASFAQSANVVLESGKPVVAAEWPDPLLDRDRRVMVEVKGTIVK